MFGSPATLHCFVLSSTSVIPACVFCFMSRNNNTTNLSKLIYLEAVNLQLWMWRIKNLLQLLLHQWKTNWLRHFKALKSPVWSFNRVLKSLWLWGAEPLFTYFSAHSWWTPWNCFTKKKRFLLQTQKLLKDKTHRTSLSQLVSVTTTQMVKSKEQRSNLSFLDVYSPRSELIISSSWT